MTALPTFSAGSRTLRLTTPATRGTDVQTLQRMLNAEGASTTPLVEDGAYGPASQAAVKTYQRTHALTADGVVGSGTWNSLFTSAPRQALPAGSDTFEPPPKQLPASTAGGPSGSLPGSEYADFPTGTSSIAPKKSFGVSLPIIGGAVLTGILAWFATRTKR